jgi:uncharacterized protein (TIGR02466 family)
LKIDGFEARQQALISEILSLRELKTGIKVSNKGGWHSQKNLHQSESADIRWLMGEIVKASNSCVHHVKTAPEGARIALAASWANINESGDWNAPHAHFPADWSGVFYIRANQKQEETIRSENDGDILFFDPLPLGPQYRRPPAIYKKPNNGFMFLFPSYLVHMVAPHFEQEPRISVSFNFRVTLPRQNSGG